MGSQGTFISLPAFIYIAARRGAPLTPTRIRNPNARNRFVWAPCDVNCDDPHEQEKTKD